MLSAANFWMVMTAACLLWFSTITIYVAVRGASDIKHMLARLARSKSAEDEPPP